ncbi:MAG: chromosome segregation protein SMC [Bryobacterales bacterium]|nr:chromosome segregation protein SMC [Bryobacterales bacterium]
MLRLKRVELQGFKSFAERTELRFPGNGIAAVVGPNGCGKSNLSDAISWVLGEQSAKTLRGARMEDVIFAGTRERKPLSMAQVTMVLFDPNYGERQAAAIDLQAVEEAQAQPGAPEGATAAAGDASSEEVVQAAPAETPGEPASRPTLEVAVVEDGAARKTNGNGHANGHSNGHANGHANGHSNGPAAKLPATKEVTITRRLYRSGDSEYLIDGRHARLRDIQDLFMGTGLGPESYAIIEQGRIGQLLSSKPADRRAVIEEAAGISKFKTRRRLAEAKLESAKQNLSRVFDILEEVGRQANSLKRQAAKAQRYKELHGELVVQLRQALGGRHQLLEREATRIATELAEANASFQKLADEVNEREKEQHERQEQAYKTEAELTAARQRLAELRVEAERTRGRLESQARQIGSIESRLQQGEADSTDLEQRLRRMAEEIQGHTQALAELEQNAAQARQSLEEKTRERDQRAAELRQKEQGIEGARQLVLRLLGEASTLKNQLAQMETYLQSLERDSARLQREEQMASADLERLDARKGELTETLAARQLELESLADQRRRVEADLQQRKGALGDARRLLEQLRQEASRLKARKDSLEEILSHRAYTAESVKRLFSACEQGQVQDLKPLGVLADFVEVENSHEKAAEEFLHEELEYVLVKNWTQAEAGIDLMRTDLDGRATFLVEPEPGDSVACELPEPVIGPETGIVARLSEVLRMTNGLTQAPAALLPRLSRCFMAEDRTAAQRLAQTYPDFYFLLSDGVCYHGHAISGGRKTGSGPLALKRELRELTTQSAQKQTAVEEILQRIEEFERELQLLGEELERLRGQQQGQEKDALALDHEIRKLTEEYSRANSRVSVAKLELQRIEKEVERVRAGREQNLRVVEEKDAQRQVQEESLEAARAAVAEQQQAVARLSEEHSALRVQVAEREERRRSERAAQQRLEQQTADVARRRQEILNEMERLGVERNRLLNDNIELDKRGAELTGLVESSDAGSQSLAAAEQQHREALASMEEALRQLRAQVQGAQEKRSQVEMALVEKRAALKYLEETCRKELNVSLQELGQTAENVPDEVALLEAEEKYASLKQRIEALGGVNPQALEEYEEAQRRYDFLNTQRQDLLDSVRDTEKAIQEIDVESKKRFSEAFAIINQSFRETFEKLFGGGIAEMRLTDESNVIDSGIDIVASPPGKRLQNVLLLSGGEKALTAISLLMAIFKFSPSPFCILDEVDAPLDEPNIKRMMGLLREMSDQTQFIIITHAKRTMEAAGTMFGVTMQEPGVSRLVSVKFNQSTPPPPPSGMNMPVMRQ